MATKTKLKDKLLMAYYLLLFRFWDRVSLVTKNETMFKGYNAMALAYKQRYRLIKYKPKGRGRNE
jgi:hypothetical protein